MTRRFSGAPFGEGTQALLLEPAKPGAIEFIQSYLFQQVREKIVLENSIPEEQIDEAIVEFKKYLTLIAMGYRRLGMISRPVDEVWHTFILFTADYAAFCDEAFGGFLHHQPGVPSKPLGTGPRQRFLEAYHEVYGALPQIWGADADACWGSCSVPSTNCQDSNCHDES